jgi:serine protease Do
VLSTDGYIVTNEHVVDGSELVTVSFSDGRLYEAELLGADPVTDLALLKIDAQGLVPIDVGSTADLQIGDPAIAAGSPLGLAGGPTVTVGVISAFDREVQTGPAATDRLLGMLQTDAPITRGSSGGALVDAEGALIGVTSAVGVSDVGVEGIGFAIPIEVVQRITDELIATGEVTHSFLGIEGRTSFEEQFDGAEQAVGVFIQAIVDDSGAEAAGLEEGDVITSIEGAEVRTINSLVGRLRRYKVGQPLDVDITRGGRQLTLTIELGPRPDDV